MKYNPGNDTLQAASELVKIEHAFMSVDRFKRQYLGRFWENDPTVYEEWLRHIGTPFRRCDLVDQGQKVGEVPPLAKQVETHKTDSPRYSLYERLTTLQNHVKRLPHAENRLTDAALKDLFTETGADPTLVGEWDALFKAFGYPGYLTSSEESSGEESSQRAQFDGYTEL